MKLIFSLIVGVTLISSVVGLNFHQQTVMETTDGGSVATSVKSLVMDAGNGSYITYSPSYSTSQVLWHYSVASGLTGKNTSIGFNSTCVFAGSWYGGAKMFQGIGGSGTPEWEMTQPSVGANQYWKYWATNAVSSESSDIFYSLSSWEVWDDMNTPSNYNDDTLVSVNFQVSKYNHSSATPEWTWDGTDYFIQGSVDQPGKVAISDDGGFIAVTGIIENHLAVVVFEQNSSTPLLVYQDSNLTSDARQLRITGDGSKIIFRKSAVLYRVDVATGNLEASYSLDASTDCFGVSSDGSVIAYGFTNAYVIQWNGTSYSSLYSFPVSGYYGGAAAVNDSNDLVYFGFYKNNYLSNRIYCYNISQNNITWVYDYPTGSGGNQDIISWMDCSEDGRWLVAGSWGCQYGGGDEVEVFDCLNPTAPVFTINTPGSVFHVDISPDGGYISSTGKHVHANTMGSGIDLYFAETDALGVAEQPGFNQGGKPVVTNYSGKEVLISFDLINTTRVSLDIYDVKGSRIATLIDQIMHPGNYEIVREVSKKPIIASITYRKTKRGYFTVMGDSLEKTIAALEEEEVDVIGSNCTLGSNDMVGLLKESLTLTDLPLSVKPNAGQPVVQENQTIYEQPIADFVEDIKKMVRVRLSICQIRISIPEWGLKEWHRFCRGSLRILK